MLLNSFVLMSFLKVTMVNDADMGIFKILASKVAVICRKGLSLGFLIFLGFCYLKFLI